MATLEQLEGLLAEALQCLDDSAGLVRELPELETNPNLKLLGHSINNIWEVREQIHSLRPDLKPPFVLEHDQDKLRYDKLDEISHQAHAAKTSGNVAQASALFARLRSSSAAGYFCMVAEAGLFRLSERKSIDA
jgi:hypothetical protein